jgi:hypothetical protein
MYKYRLYGLNVESNMELNCYPAEFSEKDLTIKFTKNADEARAWLDDICGGNPFREIAVNDGHIYICNSENIVVHAGKVSNLNLLTVYLLGAAVSNILLLKNVFTLHANTVLFEGCGLLLAGYSTAGKSTLSTGFYKNGGKIVSDDVSRIELDAAPPFIYPGIPSLKLWRETAEELGVDLSGAILIQEDYDKYIVSKKDMFCDFPVPASAFINIVPDDGDEVELIKENITNELNILIKNTYSRKRIPDAGKKEEYYRFLLRFCEKVPVYTLRRPADTLSVDRQISLIKEKIIHG